MGVIRTITLCLGLLLASAALADGGARTFSFRYSTIVGPIEEGATPRSPIMHLDRRGKKNL